jgi:hypothetical protein
MPSSISLGNYWAPTSENFHVFSESENKGAENILSLENILRLYVKAKNILSSIPCSETQTIGSDNEA